MYKIIIDETGRNSLKEKPELFNRTIEYADIPEDIRNFLKDRYGKIPKIRESNKVFLDNHDGMVGFTYSYWN